MLATEILEEPSVEDLTPPSEVFISSAVATSHADLREPEDLEGYKSALKSGEIPLRLYEELRIVDPNSDAAKTFEREVIAVLKQHLPPEFYDLNKNDIRILLSDTPSANACHISFTEPPTFVLNRGLFELCDVPEYFLKSNDLGTLPADILATKKDIAIGSVAELLGLMVHEIGHRKIRESDKTKHLDNNKFEEGYLYYRPAEELAKVGFHPGYFSYGMSKIALQQPKFLPDFYQITDVHPSKETTRSILKTSVGLNIDKVSNPIENLRFDASHPLVVAARTGKHETYVEQVSGDTVFSKLSANEQLQYIENLYKRMEYKTPSRLVDLGKLVESIDPKKVDEFYIEQLGKTVLADIAQADDKKILPTIRISNQLLAPLARLRGDTKVPVIGELRETLDNCKKILAVIKAKGTIPTDFVETCSKFNAQLDSLAPAVIKYLRIFLLGQSVDIGTRGQAPAWGRLYELASSNPVVIETLFKLGVQADFPLLKSWISQQPIQSPADVRASLAKLREKCLGVATNGRDSMDQSVVSKNGIVVSTGDVLRLNSLTESEAFFINQICSERVSNLTLQQLLDNGLPELIPFHAENYKKDANGLVAMDQFLASPEAVYLANRANILGDIKIAEAFVDTLILEATKDSSRFEGLKNLIFPKDYRLAIDGVKLQLEAIDGLPLVEEEDSEVSKHATISGKSIHNSKIEAETIFSHPLLKIITDVPDLFQDEKEQYQHFSFALMFASERTDAGLSSFSMEELNSFLGRIGLEPINSWHKAMQTLASCATPSSVKGASEDPHERLRATQASICACKILTEQLMRRKALAGSAIEYFHQGDRLAVSYNLHSQTETFIGPDEEPAINRIKSIQVKKYYGTLDLIDACERWPSSFSHYRFSDRELADSILSSLLTRISKLSPGEQQICCEIILSGSKKHDSENVQDRIANPTLRARVIATWVNATAQITGPDLGPLNPHHTEYLENLKGHLDRIAKTINRIDCIEMRSELANAICSQYASSALIRDYDTDLTAITTDGLLAVGMGVDIVFAAALDNTDIRDLALDLLLSPGNRKDKLNFLSDLRSLSPETYRSIGKASDESVDATEEQKLYAISMFYENFWAAPTPIRILLTSKLIDEGGAPTNAIQQATFSRTIEHVLKSKKEKELYEPFLNSWIGKEHPSRREVLLSALMVGGRNRVEKGFGVGATLATIAPQHSGAATKICQMAAGTEQVHPEIRDGLQTTKYNAAPPCVRLQSA